jgi:hypothetical protein
MRLPYWHAKLDERTHDLRLATHCPALDRTDPRLPAVGFVPCQPEALRNRAEKRLRELDVDIKTLSLDAYSLARLVRSEWATATTETKVAAAECVINLAKRLRTTPTKLLLKNDHNIDLYGRLIQGRGFDTSLDPTIGDLQITNFVIEGKSENFARHADSYAHPDRLGDRLTAILPGWMGQNAWVGHLPNVPLSTLIAFHHVGTQMTPEQKAANDRALLALRAGEAFAAPTDTSPHPRWELAKAVGIAAGAGLLLFGAGVAVSEFSERPWKSWKES